MRLVISTDKLRAAAKVRAVDLAAGRFGASASWYDFSGYGTGDNERQATDAAISALKSNILTELVEIESLCYSEGALAERSA